MQEKQDPEIDATTRIAIAIIAMNVLLERVERFRGNKNGCAPRKSKKSEEE